MNPLWFVVIVLALAGLALLGYSLRVLDLAGSIGGFVLGLVVAWLGGLDWLAVLVIFTGVGFLATRFGRRRKIRMGTEEARGGERSLSNVLANGSAAALAALATLLDVVPDAAAALAFAAAVAAVASDTLASEVGSLSRRARIIMPPFPIARAGQNGAVSWLGQAAALVGAAVIAVVCVPLLGLSWSVMWVPVVAGFAGCQLDSVLGATLEGNDVESGLLSKGDVNFISSASATLVVLVAASLL